MIIYKTTNKINGKVYIGQTIRKSEKYGFIRASAKTKAKT